MVAARWGHGTGRGMSLFVATAYALVETLAALTSVWLLASSVTMWICAETGWTPTNIRKHQRHLVIYTLRGRTLHLTCFCNEFLFCWTGGIRTEIEGRKVDLPLFKGVALVHLVSLFCEAENVKISFSTQTWAWEVSRALAVWCWYKTDVTESDPVAPFQI